MVGSGLTPAKNLSRINNPLFCGVGFPMVDMFGISHRHGSIKSSTLVGSGLTLVQPWRNNPEAVFLVMIDPSMNEL